MATPIDALRPVLGRTVVDTHTGATVWSYGPTEEDARLAYRRADRLDQRYGAVRYVVKPTFGEPPCFAQT